MSNAGGASRGKQVCTSGLTLGDLQRSLVAWVLFPAPMIRQWQCSHPLAAIHHAGVDKHLHTTLSPATKLWRMHLAGVGVGPVAGIAL